MNPPMPGPLKAARIILFVTAGLVGVSLVMSLLSLFFLLGAPEQEQRRLLAESGTDLGEILLRFALGLLSAVALATAGVLLPKGGRRAHLLARLLVGGAALVTIVGAVLTDRAAAMVVLSPLVVLILLQLRASHEWFVETERT
ncbi:hypothetical protein [Nocardiopsis lambiniae]|uniref:DUF4345 domain-containing protein n=1 Tax=Nocardiopsis lambiniae TaxID=3075539 RepID=A0ABU2M9L7_9ACTN|nr:hypothetical protein [Nocardiopsis sp. DSM 44743]MDT0329357.1 hypothetical protein [Nocardiopsis sp. DSM 44743]